MTREISLCPACKGPLTNLTNDKYQCDSCERIFSITITENENGEAMTALYNFMEESDTDIAINYLKEASSLAPTAVKHWIDLTNDYQEAASEAVDSILTEFFKNPDISDVQKAEFRKYFGYPANYNGENIKYSVGVLVTLSSNIIVRAKNRGEALVKAKDAYYERGGYSELEDVGVDVDFDADEDMEETEDPEIPF